MCVSLKDKTLVFNRTTIPLTKQVSNIKSIFKLSGLSHKCIYFTVWSNQDPKKIHILQLVDMSLKSLLTSTFILHFLPLSRLFIHLLKKPGHLSYSFLQSGFC